MKIPILINHDHSKLPIGYIAQNEELHLEILFNDRSKITTDMMLDVFGNIGFRILDSYEENEVLYITKALLIEFSLSQ